MSNPNEDSKPEPDEKTEKLDESVEPGQSEADDQAETKKTEATDSPEETDVNESEESEDERQATEDSETEDESDESDREEIEAQGEDDETNEAQDNGDATEGVPESDAGGEGDELRGLAAFFEHPDHLMAAAERTRDSEYEQFDAFSPFPIHGMDEALGVGRSWIPWVTAGAGLVGFLSANAMQFGMMTFDWPMIIGGKPFAPWPSFVPIMFELTVLIGGVTTGVVMLMAAGCFQSPDIIDERITQDRFVLWISADDPEFSTDDVVEYMEEMNPLEIKHVTTDNG